MRSILWLALLACWAVVGVYAQPKAVYDKKQYEFGSVLWNEPALASFRVTNAGKGFLFIRDVKPSCGCTLVNWTKEAIKPGDNGEIKVAFDAAMLGHFHKHLAVYTNCSKAPVYLSLVGDVVREKPVVEGDFPLKVGELYVSADNIEFDDVNRGDMPSKTLTVVNTGRSACMPSLMHLPKYLSAVTMPERLRGGQRGKIIVTLDSKELRNMGLTQTSVYVSRNPGDKVDPSNEISVSAVLLPAFDNLSAAQLALAPSLELSATELDLGTLNGKRKTSGTVVLTNKGRSTLSLRSLQVFSNALNVSLSKRKLAPGASAKLKITVVGKYLEHSKRKLRVLLITNDPKSPKVTINVKAKL